MGSTVAHTQSSGDKGGLERWADLLCTCSLTFGLQNWDGNSRPPQGPPRESPQTWALRTSLCPASVNTCACPILPLSLPQGDKQPCRAAMGDTAAQKSLAQEPLPGELSLWLTRLEQASSEMSDQVAQLIFLQLARSERQELKLPVGQTPVSGGDKVGGH